MQIYGGHDATVASETREYGCISKYEFDEREELSLVLAPTMPSAEWPSAGEGVPLTPEAELFRPRLSRRAWGFAWLLGVDMHSRFSALQAPHGRWRSHSFSASAHAAHSLLREIDYVSKVRVKRTRELTPSDTFANAL